MEQLNLFTAPGMGINEHGVMSDDWQAVERFSDEARRGKTPLWGWDIRVAQFPDGLWRSASSYMAGNMGWSSPLCAQWPGHPSRALALREAVETARRYLPRDASPRALRALREVEALYQAEGGAGG